jgi:hypothetical protein
MTITSITREIIQDCLDRLGKGDSCAAFDLASQVMSHADEKDIELNLAIVEALALSSKNNGCEASQQFLAEQWDAMKESLRRKWARGGLINADES